MTFKVNKFTDIESFSLGCWAFLLKHEDRNNLLLSLIRYMSESPKEKGSPIYRTVSAAGAVVGAALRTGDDRALIFSQMPHDAAEVLWKSVSDAEPAVRELTGPEDLVDMLAVASGYSPELMMHLGAYSAVSVVDPPRVNGRMRLATVADIERLLSWSQAFSLEAMGREAPSERAVVEEKIRRDAVYVWEDGEPVCQTYCAAPTVNGIRITGVYTPKGCRGRGYASNCVAALTRVLLSRGYKFVFLFTDLSNPTSNAIYQKVGFRHFANLKQVKLV